MATNKSKCDLEMKVAPKLTPAQKRVYDWLGERKGRYAAWHSKMQSYRLHTDDDDSTLETYHPSTIRSLVERMLLYTEPAPLGATQIRYIHPKFAGGKHDAE